MPRLVLKDLPRYECLVEAAKQFPDLDPSACEAFMHLMRTSEEVGDVLDEHFTAHHTTQGRFLVMMLLLDKKGACDRQATTPAELAEAASVSRATISGLLDSLERDGFVRRRHDAQDRRQLTVQLTAAGERFMHEFLPGHFRLLSRLMNNLSTEERRTLVTLLNKIGERTVSELDLPERSIPASSETSALAAPALAAD